MNDADRAAHEQHQRELEQQMLDEDEGYQQWLDSPTSGLTPKFWQSLSAHLASLIWLSGLESLYRAAVRSEIGTSSRSSAQDSTPDNPSKASPFI